MIWDWLSKRRRPLRGPKTKALATVFEGAQKPYVDPGKHAWIIRECAKELESISVRIHGIHDLPSPPEDGQRVLIGAAFYSLHELKLLDAIMARLRGQRSEERLEVFDVLTCRSQADFEACLPGIGNVFQTPVVGNWKHGVLENKASGHRAVETIKRHYGIA